MRYVISDIHGNLRLFNEILEKIDLKDTDELYVLGDMIDRHSRGIEIMMILMNMPNAKVILGNHEWMMMRALGFPRREDTGYRVYKRHGAGWAAGSRTGSKTGCRTFRWNTTRRQKKESSSWCMRLPHVSMISMIQIMRTHWSMRCGTGIP